jgi:16S rRNA G966 N2-methylase RsmD
MKKFLLPPFTVLNCRDDLWQDRKKRWIKLGLRGELGRDKNILFDQDRLNESMKCSGLKGKFVSGNSVFDPVLCELMYNWFCPTGGSILDPFAGDSTKGIVASMHGHPYTGIELRAEQVEENQKQAKLIGVDPCWITGDSSLVDSLLPKVEMFDLVFTSPPYYDLEVYSADKKDGSAFSSYRRFMDWYTDIFRQSVKRLRDNRFLVVKVGEVRNKKTGMYRNFVGDNVRCFTKYCGLNYYNELILVTAIGSLVIRTPRQFSKSRKLGKTHQNVLVFYKGDVAEIRKQFPEITYGRERAKGSGKTDQGVRNQGVR